MRLREREITIKTTSKRQMDQRVIFKNSKYTKNLEEAIGVQKGPRWIDGTKRSFHKGITGIS